MDAFIVGPPVRGDIFYNRKELINSITASFGNNYALVGIRRVGKTSCMLKLADVFREKGIVPVTISVHEIIPLTTENFLKRYSVAVANAYIPDAGISQKMESFFAGKWSGFADFIKNVKISVSIKELATFWFEQSQSLEKDYTQLIERTILNPENIASESGKKFVIFIDEFQGIKALGAEFLSALRENMQKTPNVEYIISGSAIGLMSQILGSKKSPFYGFFLSERMEGIDEASAQKLLARIKMLNVTLADNVINEVIKRTKCYPLYLQGFGDSCLKMALLTGKKRITMKEFDKCWNRMLDQLYFHFQYLEGELRGKKREIMKVIATKNKHHLAEISKATEIDSAALGTYLKRLIDEGFLVRENGYYTFSDPVFEEWMRIRENVDLF
jgi:AAA+ ATPase superfamily predicted ATPase